jgi:hypothetical protein
MIRLTDSGCKRKIFITVLFVAIIVASSVASSRYPNDRIHSVITASVIAKIRSIIDAGSNAGRHIARFIKIGDSITTSGAESHSQPQSPFLCQCICADYVSEDKAWDFRRNLDTHKTALAPSVNFFLNDTMADGTSSFNRASAAAAVGMVSSWAVNGSPSPLRKEIDAVNPQFSIVMYGANDVGGYGSMHTIMATYMRGMRRIVDSCIIQGIVPILTATCPRVDKMEYTLAMSYLVRALAQQYQIPFIDYYRAMMLLPEFGLRDDGVHPNYLDYNKSCWFTKEGLIYGYNLRNLITLEMLSTMHKIATTTVTAIDSEAAVLDGNGTASDPFIIDAVPFVDVQTLSESNTAVTYKLTLQEQTRMRMLITTQNSADISISIANSGNVSVAQTTAEPAIDQTLGDGTYTITVKSVGPDFGAYQCILYNKDNDGAPVSSKVFFKSSSVWKPYLMVYKNKRNMSFVPTDDGVVSIYRSNGKILYKSYIGANNANCWNADISGLYIIKFSTMKTDYAQTIIID